MMHEDKGPAKSIHNWYFGDISMEKSERLLNKYGEEGDFIVRDSSVVSPHFNILHRLPLATNTTLSVRLHNLPLG